MDRYYLKEDRSAREEAALSRTFHLETTVLPGHRIEVSSPELPEGRPATVIIVVGEEETPKRSFREVIGNYPGRQLFKSAEEVEAYLRAERDSWDR